MSDERFLAIKVVMMPRDTNPQGTIFGGVILSYIDQAGAVGAYHFIRQSNWPNHPLVTVAMNGVEFHQPILVGDCVSFWVSLVRVGRSSMTVHVDVESDRSGPTEKLTEAEITYVAIRTVDGSRIPTAIREP